MILIRCVVSSLMISLGLMLISASLPPDIMEARRTIPKPPTACQDCKPAIANASDCE